MILLLEDVVYFLSCTVSRPKGIRRRHIDRE
jgi:hypothetical protein